MLAGGLADHDARRSPSSTSSAIDPVGGALRLGVLYDLLGRTIDARRAQRHRRALRRPLHGRPRATPLASTALAGGAVSAARCRARTPEQMQLLHWAALLHEIGMSVSHIGFHKHGAYILQHADMPGFLRQSRRGSRCWSSAAAAA